PGGGGGRGAARPAAGRETVRTGTAGHARRRGRKAKAAVGRGRGKRDGKLQDITRGIAGGLRDERVGGVRLCAGPELVEGAAARTAGDGGKGGRATGRPERARGPAARERVLQDGALVCRGQEACGHGPQVHARGQRAAGTGGRRELRLAQGD